MEYNQQTGGTAPGKRRGPGAYWIVVFVLLGLTLAAGIVLTVLLLGRTRGTVIVNAPYSAQTVPEATPAPASGEAEEEKPATKDATVTPAPGSVEMPELDGVAPDLSGYEDSVFYNNPIPEIYDAVSDSVVGVINYQTQEIGATSLLTTYGSGSGFIVSTDGYVLTNAHVIEGAERLTVIFTGGDEVEATVIGYDYETDVAVLKINREGLKAIAIGNSDDVRVGDFVIAIGNPLSTTQLADTTTLGVISATSRTVTIDNYTNEYLQTDAAINFGNSGGPLLNMNGEVIGMNSAKSVTAGYDSYGNAISAEGIGFALPINKVMEIMEHLITYGEMERPAVGITVLTLDETYAALYGVDVTEGVYVASVVKDGPAARAGLVAGDVIISANGVTVTDKDTLVDMISACTIGDTIAVEVYRDGEVLEMTIILANKINMDFDDVEE